MIDWYLLQIFGTTVLMIVASNFIICKLLNLFKLAIFFSILREKKVYVLELRWITYKFDWAHKPK